MRTLAVVPARAGSKGLPGKNKRPFMGKPLVAWAIEVGKRTCTRTCVTSDDPDILEIADEYGVVGIDRPPALAQDDTPMLDVLRHVLAVDGNGIDALVLLQPTAPLRKDEHVKLAFWTMLLKGKSCDSVASVVEIPAHYSPDFACYIEGGLLTLPALTRRQQCREAYSRDGTVYVIRPEVVKAGTIYGHCVPLILPASESCNIDTEDDWARAEQMWRQRGTTHV